MFKDKNTMHEPSTMVKEYSEAAQAIEGFAEKASNEIHKGTLLGKFYSVITVMLLALFAALLLWTIIWLRKLSPLEYKVPATIISIIIIAVLFYFIWFAMITPHFNKREKNLEKLSKELDGDCYRLIQEFGRRPEGKDHFNDVGMNSHQKNAVSKMLRFGVIKFAHKSYKKGYEYAYRWTELGYELMNYMDIQKMSEEEFQLNPQYNDYKNMFDNYKKFKENVK